MKQFKVGQYAVYPGHGVGQIVALEKKLILGNTFGFYSISILDSNMRILVPVTSIDAIGIRSVISKQEAKQVLNVLKTDNPELSQATWSTRYREYMEKIKTGSVYQIAEVLRDLKQVKAMQDLSFGERKMLDAAYSILLRELNVVLGVTEL